MSMKTELRGGVPLAQISDDLRHLLGRGAAIGIAYDESADALCHALVHHAMEEVDRLLAELRVAQLAILAAHAGCIHRVFEIDEDLEAVILEE